MSRRPVDLQLAAQKLHALPRASGEPSRNDPRRSKKLPSYVGDVDSKPWDVRSSNPAVPTKCARQSRQAASRAVRSPLCARSPRATATAVSFLKDNRSHPHCPKPTKNPSCILSCRLLWSCPMMPVVVQGSSGPRSQPLLLLQRHAWRHLHDPSIHGTQQQTKATSTNP